MELSVQSMGETVGWMVLKDKHLLQSFVYGQPGKPHPARLASPGEGGIEVQQWGVLVPKMLTHTESERNRRGMHEK